MIALDTNVLARAIAIETEADAATLAQQRHAQTLLSSGQDMFAPITVIEELEWVLRGIYEMPTGEIASVLEDMLAIENLTVDRATAVAQAVVWYQRGMDFSDALHLAQAGLCSSMASFDARFAKTGRRLGLIPPVEIPGGK